MSQGKSKKLEISLEEIIGVYLMNRGLRYIPGMCLLLTNSASIYQVFAM
jgi:hypothetical protein